MKVFVTFIPFLILLVITRLVQGAEDPDDIFGHLKPADGLAVSVWAHSPLFFNPTGMDVDERGRIWVSEALNYRGFNNQKRKPRWHEKGDRIVILEDTDGDGKADTSKVFVQDKDLTAPLGVAVIGNKVVVSCSPHLLMYVKNDKDEVVRKEKFLSGWGGFDHDHSLHKIEVGPDGRWYGNAGNAGPHEVKGRDGWTLRAGSWYTGGTPYNKENTPGLKSDDGRVYSGGVLFSILPDGTGMRVLGHGYRNPYGHGLDSFGNIWMNDNDDTQSCRTTWIMRFSDCGYTSKDGTRSWGVDRRPGQSVRSAHWRQDDPGVIPSGHVYGNGSPTGLTYYENGALGKRYEGGLLLSCEAGQNIVWGYRRIAEGAGFRLEGFPFLTSTGVQDPNYQWSKRESNRAMWFRPSDVIVGTDGAVYICDWYDAVVGGHQMDDSNGRGTIYRIVAAGTKPRRANYKTAADYLKSPAPSVRNTGFRSLKKQGETALPALKEMLSQGDRFIRARAVWALTALGEKGWPELKALMKDADPEIRIAAYRALVQAGHPVLPQAAALAKDSSPMVRREVALSMRDLPLDQAQVVLVEIAAGYDGKDRWYLEALGTGCEGKELEMYAALLGHLGGPTLTWSKPFADIAWRLHPATAIPALSERAQSADLTVGQRRQAIDSLAFIIHKSAARAMEAAAGKGPKDLRDYAAYWLKHRAKNDWKNFGIKQSAVQAPKVVSGKLPPLTGKERFSSKILKKGFVDIDLDLTGASTLHLIATDGGNGISCDWVDWLNPVLIDKKGRSHDLTRFNWTGVNNGWGDLNKGKTCVGSPLKVDGKVYETGLGGHAPMRLDYILPGQQFVRFKVRAAVDDGSPDRGGATYRTPMASVAFQIHHDGYTPGKGSPVKAALQVKGDSTVGAKLFASMACSTCHTFKGQGRELGPDLTKIRGKYPPPELMEAIADPNAGILAGYETVLIETKDERTFYGFVIADGDSLTLKDVSGATHTISRKNVERRETQSYSLMPQIPFEPKQLADLVAYLISKGK